MKKFIVLSIVLLMLAGFAITSSAEDLVVGREGMIVGTLTVTESGGDLVVTYTITDPEWELLETHLYVGKTDPEGLTSAPGQFPYSELPLSPISQTYTIALSDIDFYELGKGKKWHAEDNLGIGPGDKIYIAAQAELGKINPVTDEAVLDPITGLQIEETAWAEGDPIRLDKNWAMYFEFVEFVVPE